MLRRIVAYIQIGIAVVFTTSALAGMAKATWVLSGTRYSRIHYLLAQVVQGAVVGWYIFLMVDGMRMLEGKNKVD